MFAQTRTIRGTVFNVDNEPVIGAAVVATQRVTEGTSTGMDGSFSLNVSPNVTSLTVSFVGMAEQEVSILGISQVAITLMPGDVEIDEVVVVGYGQQRKASVVGAITQTTGEVLQRAAAVTSIGQALTGNLPGVITMQNTGMPGQEEPKITIRSASSWNSSDPLVLVDGIERPMGSVDISSVESISVLKDASATAVYGVKGANGVILITTKRGQDGRAVIDIGFNATMKAPSKLPNKLDSYDALMARNVAIEHELGVSPTSWANIRPVSFIENYRNQTTLEQRERYPNIDWQDELFKKTAMSYNAYINVSGGTPFVKYFVAADYLYESDLFKRYDNNRGYKGGYGFNRINVRANLDFQITKTTTLSMNLAGSNGVTQAPQGGIGNDWSLSQRWAGAYNIAPDVYMPRYSDGAWGFYPYSNNVSNSVEQVSNGGSQQTTDTRINTDFTLVQKLDFITPGLSARGTISWDNAFRESNRGITDNLFGGPNRKYIDPDTGQTMRYPGQENEASEGFQYVPDMAWSTSGGSVANNQTLRNLFYQAQLNWARDFGRHSLTAMGVVNRQENARGSIIPSYREDWAFRVTYDYADRYMFEYNGAYNGSEKFAEENRFAFFNSGAVGWMISEEKFMEPVKFLDMLKVRLSYGEIGDDNVRDRWLYMTQWAYRSSKWGENGASSTRMDLNRGLSPYYWYREASLGNPDVKWETVRKTNLGIDYSFLNGLFAGTVELFRDERRDILISGNDRSVPTYLGMDAPTANLGRVKTHGYELELRVNKRFNNGVRLWANMNMTHAVNEVIERDDQAMRPAYQKRAGYAMDQAHAYINGGYINNYDQLYGSTAHDTNDAQKLPGDYLVIDFNNDGVIDNKDSVPWGYSGTPENTYNATLGVDWKGFSAFVQFYGTSNVTRQVTLQSFSGQLNTVYDAGTWWSMSTPNADVTVPRWASTPSYNNSTQYLYDGSYLRLKNAEVAYTFTDGWVKRVGMGSLKVYLNGNNLWLWTKMPDDRESSLTSEGVSQNSAYPTVRRFVLGIKFTL